MDDLTRDRLERLVLYAYAGEDELASGSGAIGLKQGIVPAGCVPLVSVNREKLERDALRRQLQAQADRWGRPIAGAGRSRCAASSAWSRSSTSSSRRPGSPAPIAGGRRTTRTTPASGTAGPATNSSRGSFDERRRPGRFGTR